VVGKAPYGPIKLALLIGSMLAIFVLIIVLSRGSR